MSGTMTLKVSTACSVSVLLPTVCRWSRMGRRTSRRSSSRSRRMWTWRARWATTSPAPCARSRTPWTRCAPSPPSASSRRLATSSSRRQQGTNEAVSGHRYFLFLVFLLTHKNLILRNQLTVPREYKYFLYATNINIRDDFNLLCHVLATKICHYSTHSIIWNKYHKSIYSFTRHHNMKTEDL